MGLVHTPHWSNYCFERLNLLLVFLLTFDFVFVSWFEIVTDMLAGCIVYD